MKLGKEQVPEGVAGTMHHVVEGGVVGGAKEDRPAQDLYVAEQILMLIVC